jgi:hypothetical protein
VNPASQNERFQFRMLFSMTCAAQHLNIGRIGAQCRRYGVAFSVMSLQISCSTAFFALAAFADQVADALASWVSTIGTATIPFWVCSSAHGAPSGGRHAATRAIVHLSLKTRRTLKWLVALFAHGLEHGWRFSGFEQLRASDGARVCRVPYMRVIPLKVVPTGRACEDGLASGRDFARVVCHGY